MVWLGLLLACSTPAPPEPPPVAPPPIETPAPTPNTAIAEPFTDEECRAKGGRVITEKTYEARVRPERRTPLAPFRRCKIPSPANGQACSNDSDCAGGMCRCPAPYYGPPGYSEDRSALDGQAATGTCSDEFLQSGVWYCRVNNGHLNMNSLIID